MEKEQEMDLDTLARMVGEGFLRMEKRFDRLEGRVDGLEGEVRQTNQRIDQVIIPVIDDHSRRIKDLELAR